MVKAFGIVIVGLAAILGTVAAPQAAPIPKPSVPIKALKEDRPVAGWVDFCKRMPAECAFDVTGPAQARLDAKAWGLIQSVNREVNRKVALVTDQDHWGLPDKWDLAEDGKGDSEDLPLLKRRMLAEAGLPRRAMRITVVIDEKGEGHAVLGLVTDRGDLILDGKTDEILPWMRTGYVFIKRESQDVQGWVSLGGVVSPNDPVPPEKPPTR